MSTCVAKTIGYQLEFSDDKEQHEFKVPRVGLGNMIEFLVNVKSLVDEEIDEVTLSANYMVNINSYTFDGLSYLAVIRSDIPGEVLVTGTYKSIIQLGPGFVGGSGRTISPVIRVKAEDIMNCHIDFK